MVTPAVLPNALSTGTGVVATGIQIPASVAAGMFSLNIHIFLILYTMYSLITEFLCVHLFNNLQNYYSVLDVS